MTLDLHRHSVNGGYIEHWHEMGNPNYKDDFSVEKHVHLVILGDRNYVHEYSGPAEWIGGGDGRPST